MSIYDTLNDKQKEAVFHTEGPLLILAGAGSGKTRVLTHRIAYLIEEKQVNPWNIMAITFTNKAAAEMRERVDKIVGFGAESIWVSTFHSSCVRILRRHIEYLGYSTNFTIYDGDDQRTLMKQIFKRLDVDTKQFKERAVLSRISSAKDDMITPEEFGFTRCTKEDMKGGTPEENAEITLSVLNGEKGAKRDAVLLNAGAALYIGGKAESIKEGIILAAEIIDSGKALTTLRRLIEVSNRTEVCI